MKILEARSLGVISFVLSIFAVLVPALGWVNLLAGGTHRAGDVLVVCLLVAFIAGVAAALLAIAARAVHRRSSEQKKPLRPARNAIVVLVAALVLNLWAVVVLPNFLQPSSRSKVSRAKSEIRNLAVNLETYFIDHNCYPPAVDLNGRVILYDAEGATVSAGCVPWMLTTPISYTTSLPWDPFHKRENGLQGPYRYATNGLSCWIMTSCGPDRDYDIGVGGFPDPEKGNCEWRTFMTQFGGPAVEYDGTNGTMSSGDVIRVGP